MPEPGESGKGRGEKGEAGKLTGMDVFLFDLDGTLADSIGDIAECANLVRDSFGLAPLPEAMILGFIGKGSRWLVAHTLAAQTDETAETLDDAVVDEAVRRWVRLYEQHMMDRTRLFPGIDAALSALNGPKAIVTNKPGESARELCRRAGLDKICGAIVGMGDVPQGKPARDGIDLAVSLAAPAFGPGDRAVFVGDSEVDGAAAAAASLPFVGVLWGLGTEENLRRAGAAALARTPDELAARIYEALDAVKPAYVPQQFCQPM